MAMQNLILPLADARDDTGVCDMKMRTKRPDILTKFKNIWKSDLELKLFHYKMSLNPNILQIPTQNFGRGGKQG